MGSGSLLQLIQARMPDLTRPIQKNLALVSAALLALCSGPRSANGRLSLSALARVLPSKGSEKSRAKRFWRFLANRRLCPEAMIPQLVRLVLGCVPAPRVPLLVDQTDIAGVQTILVGVIFRGRVLPVAFTCFLYCRIWKSQNLLETNLLKLVADAFPDGREPVFIADRQYGRSQLLQAFSTGQPYILRAKSKVTICHKGKARPIRWFRTAPGAAARYPNVLYHERRKIPVDLVVFHDPSFQEVWYLLTPPGSAQILPTEEVVRLYRQRMQIEQGFRDWKTHLGVRGLRLEVDRANRLTRLLLALALAYILVVLLGSSPLAERWRGHFETARRTPRHGTCRILSVLTMGTLMLGVARCRRLSCAYLVRLVVRMAAGAPAVTLVRGGPK